MLEILVVVALAAQSMSAALVGGRRNIDYFGVCLLACVTALGGGTLRDTMLGHYPLAWVANPHYILICCGAAILTIIFARVIDRLRMPFLLLDAVGLVSFTVVGCQIALSMGHNPMIVIIFGMVTGCAGGVIRDILCNDVPLLLSGELYATVSIVTGGVYLIGLAVGGDATVVMAAAMLVGFALRVLAIVYHWEMPRFVYDRDMR
jgi:uncharacterized membrane protein YeiH